MSRSNAFVILCICAILCGLTSCGVNYYPIPEQEFAESTAIPSTKIEVHEERTTFEKKRKMLIPRHITAGEFHASVEKAKLYSVSNGNEDRDNPDVVAGVIPHHTTAATLISSFFRTVANYSSSYDTVVIIAPNHDGDIADVIVSRLDWDIGDGIACDTDIIDAVFTSRLNTVTIIENDNRMEEDHSASVLIPYLHYYLPDSKVAPILVSRTLSPDGVIAVADMLTSIINESGKRILLVCSADFSHYLTPDESVRKDAITLHAIEAMDYKQIHDFSNEYIDSPASLIIFLRYLDSFGITAQVLENTDASEFLGSGIQETTSYFVMMGMTDVDK